MGSAVIIWTGNTQNNAHLPNAIVLYNLVTLVAALVSLKIIAPTKFSKFSIDDIIAKINMCNFVELC